MDVDLERDSLYSLNKKSNFNLIDLKCIKQ